MKTKPFRLKISDITNKTEESKNLSTRITVTETREDASPCAQVEQAAEASHFSLQ